MSKKQNPHPADTKGAMAAFKQLPEKTKDQMKQKDRNEKTSGQEKIVIDKKIDNKASK